VCWFWLWSGLCRLEVAVAHTQPESNKEQNKSEKMERRERRKVKQQVVPLRVVFAAPVVCRQVLFVPSTAVVDGSVGGRSCGVCGFEIPISRKGNASVLFQLACGGGLRTSFALIPIFFAKLRRRRSMLIYGGSAVEQNHECRDHAEETCGEEGIVTNE
jgi:hypothetical protein